MKIPPKNEWMVQLCIESSIRRGVDWWRIAARFFEGCAASAGYEANQVWRKRPSQARGLESI